MRDTARWCCWKKEKFPGDKKPRKVPYNPMTGERADSSNIKTFGTFGQAKLAYEMYDHTGIGVGLFGDLCCIDIDNCLEEDGSFSDLAIEIMSTMSSYTELSPSKTGMHIFFRAPGFVHDREKYRMKSSTLGLEVYVGGSTKRFMTVTGNRMNSFGLNVCPELLQAVLDKYMRKEVPKIRKDNNVATVRLKLDDDALIAKAGRARNGELFKQLMDGNLSRYASHSEADIALCNMLAFWTSGNAEQMDRIFRSSGLFREEKWDSRRGGETYGAMTIKNAIERVGETYSDMYNNRLMQDRRPMPMKPRQTGGDALGW